MEKEALRSKVVCVAGLGYVGMPLAMAFSRHTKVIGYDIDAAKLKEIEPSGNLHLTSDASDIATADFVLICVPTPVTRSREPDLSSVVNAAHAVGRNLKKGCVVVLESTVYPSVTEEILKPALEAESGMKCGTDFKIGYCPERINPGDSEHTIENTVKVVAGMDPETTELLALLYGTVIKKIHKARNIRTAEASKVIENIQRDLNIALMNELSLIFERMGINTGEVLDAAATKWNFHRYSPGLVGGHCIPVDPYYLVYKARELGYHPQVILAGRAINDYMPKHVAEMTIKALNEAGKVLRNSRVLIMGVTYKEDVQDMRESQVRVIASELAEYHIEVLGYDPMVNGSSVEKEFGIKPVGSLDELKAHRVDGVIITVAHSAFKGLSLSQITGVQNSPPVLIDLRSMFNGEDVKASGLIHRVL